MVVRHRHLTSPAVVAGLVAGLLSATLLQADGIRPPRQPPQFRSGIDLIRLDVSVLDSDRRPIRGLTSDDFTVLEDGKPQAVAVFSAVDVPGPGGLGSPQQRTPSTVDTNAPTDGRLIVVVVDDVSFHDPFAIRAAAAVGRAVIGQMGASDLAAVVFTGASGNSQGFTNDRARLLRAVARIDPTTGGTATGMADNLARRGTLTTLKMVADELATVSGRPKAIIYVGPGVSIDPALLAAMKPLEFGDVQGQTQSLITQLRQLFLAARLGNAPIYCIDPTGLAVADTSPWSREMLVATAHATGGLAILNRNDPAAGVANVFQETGSYYVLGYRATSTGTDGQFRRVTVEVKRPHAEVRAESGYRIPVPADAGTPATSLLHLTPALAGVLPETTLSLQAAALAFATPGEDEASVLIVTGVGGRASGLEASAQRVNVVGDVFTPDGNSRGSVSQSLRVTPGPSQRLPQFEILSRVSLGPGRYEIRLAVESDGSEKTGSIFCDVEVPNFSREPLSLSDVAVGVTPGPAAGPRTEVESILPFLPTTVREFSKTDHVTMFLRAYQGGKAALVPVGLRTVVRDSNGQVVRDLPEALAVGSFDRIARAADHSFELPIGSLVPGVYAVEFVATLSKLSVTRAVTFTVR